VNADAEGCEAPDEDELRRRALEAGRRTLDVEHRVLAALAGELGEEFLRAVEVLEGIRGRVVVTGMGKSGIVGHKISATLASTGTPSFFLHPAEAIHGDLGMITRHDAVLTISNSGETEEMVRLLPSLELLGVPTVAICSKAESTLARFAEVALLLPLEEEGCPIGLAPMASTTATLALGDALAAALIERKGFRPEDFAVRHPGGSLGRRLLTRVRDLMVPLEDGGRIEPGTPMQAVLEEMLSSNLGAVVVVGEGERLLGIVTDGDLKRNLVEGAAFLERWVDEVMTRTPLVCDPEVLAEAALRMMEERPGGQVTVLPVVDEGGTLHGLIRLHDILKAKIR